MVELILFLHSFAGEQIIQVIAHLSDPIHISVDQPGKRTRRPPEVEALPPAGACEEFESAIPELMCPLGQHRPQAVEVNFPDTVMSPLPEEFKEISIAELLDTCLLKLMNCLG